MCAGWTLRLSRRRTSVVPSLCSSASLSTNILKVGDLTKRSHKNCPIFLGFQLPLCSECCILFCGWFPGVWILHTDVSDHSVCSNFICSVSSTPHMGGGTHKMIRNFSIYNSEAGESPKERTHYPANSPHQCQTLSCDVTTDINPLTPNDIYRGRTAPLTSKRCTLHIYSTNIGTGYFKHGIYSPFFLFKMLFVP